MTKEQAELNLLLDLFVAGYKKSYVSVMDLKALNNDWCERIQIVLPNVGRLNLYQKFYETNNDEQIPVFKVFYSSADNINKSRLIKSQKLNAKAVKLVYQCKHYFETNEIPSESDDMVIKTVIKNSKLIQKMHNIFIKKRKYGLCEILR